VPNQLQSWLPVLSLAVAALAVVVGPFVSWHVASRQSATTLRVSNKQIVAPMRQAWINSLRELIAELLGKCAHYWAAGFEDRADSEYLRITELIYKLELFMNPNEEDHVHLVKSANDMERALSAGSTQETDRQFWDAHRSTADLAQKILKREWNRVKSEI
jgi:hypothetical protein